MRELLMAQESDTPRQSGRRWLRWTLAVLATLLILGLPRLAVYGTTQDWFTRATGHVYSAQDLATPQAASLSEGRALRYTQANHDGFQRGIHVGYDNGYQEGRDAGYQNGYGVGQTAGAATGTTLGYNEGYQDGTVDGFVTGCHRVSSGHSGRPRS
jgi:flagellar biosynthesis/type III secretory pathway protein FliH